MLILIGLVLIIAFSMVCYKFLHNDLIELITTFIGIVAAVTLAIALFILVANHATATYTVSQYNAIKDTIEESRTNETTDLERAALTTKIIETNENIANYKWNNENFFDIFIPDEWAELEPLK